MKRFALTLACTLGIAFLSFPVFLVLLMSNWAGEEAGDFLTSFVLMFLLQFVGPFPLWIVPLGMGLLAAVLWRLFNLGPPEPVSVNHE